jgi:hypothetical protein
MKRSVMVCQQLGPLQFLHLADRQYDQAASLKTDGGIIRGQRHRVGGFKTDRSQPLRSTFACSKIGQAYDRFGSVGR